MRILAVDDDPIILELVTTVLSDAGYEDVVTAGSAEQAMTVISTVERPFECFLLDILMPGIDGVALCGEIRANPLYRATPILMVSRLDEKHHFDRAFAAGASDYVTKPFDATEFRVRLGLAEQMQRQQAQLAAAQHGKPDREKPRLSEAFRLDDVPFSIANHALESYLQGVPGGVGGMQCFALKLANAVEIHRKASGNDYEFVINSLADAVTEVLAGANYFISHSGNGVISFVVHGAIDMTEEEVARAVMTEVGMLDLRLADGSQVSPDVVVGSSSVSRLTSRSARIATMREAVMNAEGIADAVAGGKIVLQEQPRDSLLDRLFGGLAA
ncbi:PleD family two-component system response regulator [Roseivivax sp. THAF30]|uniref:response regulator n=1 Tax=Roseivivax sp. THAF30 TaxID=2587852 RepID=UPI001268EC94|nr:response regulator [Roseivivax sp. THAF30]QFT62092.1 Alkaline phosphatase synthesis transcriptional regulatory protein PhoP [Roseivivax sp. THAF30]